LASDTVALHSDMLVERGLGGEIKTLLHLARVCDISMSATALARTRRRTALPQSAISGHSYLA